MPIPIKVKNTLELIRKKNRLLVLHNVPEEENETYLQKVKNIYHIPLEESASRNRIRGIMKLHLELGREDDNTFGTKLPQKIKSNNGLLLFTHGEYLDPTAFQFILEIRTYGVPIVVISNYENFKEMLKGYESYKKSSLYEIDLKSEYKMVAVNN